MDALPAGTSDNTSPLPLAIKANHFAKVRPGANAKEKDVNITKVTARALDRTGVARIMMAYGSESGVIATTLHKHW